MKFKKALAVLLSLALIVAPCISMSVSAVDDTITPPVTSNPDSTPDVDYVDPKPYIYSIDTTIFEAGEVTTVPIRLATTDGYADDVRLKLVGPEGKENAFSFYSTTGWLKVGSMDGNSFDINPYIQVSPSLADGTYPITVQFSYSRSGKNYTYLDKVNFVVQGKSSSVLFVKNANFAKAQIGKENKSNLIVNVSNPTVYDLKDIKVSFNAAASKGFSLYENFRSATIPAIPSQGVKAVSFAVYVDSTIVTGNYPLTIDMSYKDVNGTVITSSEVVYVQVTRTADAATDGTSGTPRIIVSSYKTDVEAIKAGKEFTLDFTLKNTSATTVVKNIKVVMGSATVSGTGANSAGGAVFFPSEGSNSFFISSISPQATASNSIKLMARQDVEPGVYPVLLKIDYEDAAGKPLSSEEQVSFSVVQEQRLDVQGMNIPTVGAVGSGLPVNFQYINKGKATIYNLSITVTGDFTLEGGSQYIGNLVAGFNDYFDNVIQPTKEGESKGEVVLKFEDSNGNEQEQKTPFTCTVSAGGGMGGGMDKPGMGGGIEPMPPESKGSSLGLILWFGIPTLVVIVGLLAFIIIMKKRKAKKALVEDEED